METTINNNLEKFSSIYKQELKNAITNYPQEYMYGLEKLDDVHGKMMLAVQNKSFNKDSRAFKATCKALGIKHTYMAIDEYLSI